MKKFISLLFLIAFLFTQVQSFSQVGSTSSNPRVITSNVVFTALGNTADTINNTKILNYYTYVNPFSGTVSANLQLTKLGTNHAAKLVIMSSLDNVLWTRLDSTATITTSTVTNLYARSAEITSKAPFWRFWVIGTVAGQTKVKLTILTEKK